MEFDEFTGEQDLKNTLVTEFGKACTSIFQSRHRILVQITMNGNYPIKIATAIFREFASYIKKKVLFGVITAAEPTTSDEGVRAAPFEFGLQLRGRLPFLKFQYLPYWDVQTLLGTTQDYAILDLTAQFNPDDVSIIMETVAGPGLIILITPTLDDWPLNVTRFVEQFNFYGDPLPPSRFLAHFIETVQKSNNVLIIEEEKNRLGISQITPPDPENVSKFLAPVPDVKEIASLALTTDELTLIGKLSTWLKNAMEKDPRVGSQCFLDTARGRGKTATLGLIIGQLFAEKEPTGNSAKKLHVVISSPDLLQIQAAFQTLQAALSIGNVKFQVKKIGDLLSEVSCPGGTLFYVSPGDVVECRRIDAVLIDECGSIPLPITMTIAGMGIPCVWSTTSHGYEGVGRGFALKFAPWVLKKFHKVEGFTMTTPVRYASGDPIEKLLYAAFFLDADVPEFSDGIDAEGNAELVRQPVDPNLMDDRLRAIFGLLIQAHYKTRPSDFVPMLDVPSWQIWVYQTKDTRPIGAILTTPEGGLPLTTAEELATAKKERQGLLVSWVIALHHQAPDFVHQFRGVRIARIAVNPLKQRQGIGTRMLAELEIAQKAAGISFLSTSFGGTPELVRFWLKSGYVPIHLALKRAPTTGEYSIVMIKSLNSEARGYVARFAADFKVKLVEWLRDVLYDADPETMLPIILFQDPTLESHLPAITFSQSETRRLYAYCEDILKFKAATDVIRKVMLRYVYDMHEDRPPLEERVMVILIAKIQSRSWKTIQAIAHVPAQRAYGMVREAIKRLVNFYQI